MGNICSNSFYTYWKETQWVRIVENIIVEINDWFLTFTTKHIQVEDMPEKCFLLNHQVLIQAKNDSLKTILKIPMEKTVETKVSKISLKGAI